MLAIIRFQCHSAGILGSSEGQLTERLLARLKDGSIRAVNRLDEVVHSHNTTDVTGIITEEDTAEGCKGAHHVRLDGHRGFGTSNIARTCWDYASRHFLILGCGSVVVLSQVIGAERSGYIY